MIILDTEFTGTKENQVCQLAYLDFSTASPVPGNLYFTVDDMSGYAFELHRLSMRALERLSGGRRFAAAVQEVYDLLQGKRVVGHSIRCDVRVLHNEFKRCGHDAPDTRQFCTMSRFAPVLNMRSSGQKRPKDPSLQDLMEYFKISDAAVREASEGFWEAFVHPHDARYDVCATYLCVLAAEEMGLVRGLLPKG